MKIDWTPPMPKSGMEKFIGPGATRAEIWLQSLVPVLAIVVALYLAPEWSALQQIVAALLVGDIVGGIITNATSTAKRWYHREGQGRWQHMGFISLHFIQLSVFNAVFMEFSLLWIAITGGFMLLASWLVLVMPLYLQRPVALTLYSLGLVLSLYVFDSPAGLEWFLPFFYLKLLVSHILKEAPYRP